jgi:ribose-phosphate pyrophosphokinase
MSASPDIALFAPRSTRAYGERVAAELDTALAELEERAFEDGEHKTRPLESVRGRDVYVIESLASDPHQPVNDKLVRLLFLLATLIDHGAFRVTAVLPYLCYARKDRRTKARDPVTIRYLAQLLECTGLHRVLTMDVHNLAAYQNAFRIPAEHLEARRLFADHVASAGCGLVVVSPDTGGVKRAEALRQTLEVRLQRDVPAAFMEKYRSSGRVTGERLVGEVAGCTVLLVDDLIASGGTLARAAAACRKAGATRVVAMATHAAFTPGAADALADPALDELVVTDTIASGRISSPTVAAKLSVLNTSGFVAEAIRRLHENGSLVALNGD